MSDIGVSEMNKKNLEILGFIIEMSAFIMVGITLEMGQYIVSFFFFAIGLFTAFDVGKIIQERARKEFADEINDIEVIS